MGLWHDAHMKTHHPPPHGFDKFIARARDLHGERFQYDRSSWVDFDNHVKIRCSAHGWFVQISRNHLRPNNYGGCKDCKINDTWEMFLAKAKQKHGARFEYDKKSWGSQGQSVRVKCKEHGWFSQKVFDHLRHSGCFDCARENMDRLVPLDKVLEKFAEVHGNRYSYEKVVYKGNKKLVNIICREHGVFRQKPDQHLNGNGCQKCSRRHRWTTEEFIENSKRVHGDKFTYENTKYVGALEKIIITCKKHGDFITQPSRHVLQKAGCARCSGMRSMDDFLERAKERFGDRYDYSLVEYVDTMTPVKIICKTHGVFEQPPSWHMQNSIGCQQCSYNVSGKETAWLDSINLPETAKRQAKVKLGGRLRNVDAYDEPSKTIWEFWGDWWHGHPDFFDPKDVHQITKKTYGKLYQDTQRKRDLIQKEGFRLIEIWEHEYNALVDRGAMKRPEGRMSKKRPRKRKQDPVVVSL